MDRSGDCGSEPRPPLDDEGPDSSAPIRHDQRRGVRRCELSGRGNLKPATGWKGRLIQTAGFALYLCGGEASVGVTRTYASSPDARGVSGPEVFHTGLDDSREGLDLPTGQAELVSAMSDPRYENDAAYRNDLLEKLDRSDLNF